MATTKTALIPGAGTISGVEISVHSLLEAGAHFGHQTDRWNPRMLPYIYCAKNGIHIINLDHTLDHWKRARDFLAHTVLRGGSVLFVGTKQQARESVKQEAERCGAFYVNTRWLGGTLTNFQTIKNSIDRMRKIEDLLAQAEAEDSKIKLNKKEKLEFARQLEKLEVSLGGIRSMRKLPGALFVVDIIKEAIAIEEARRLRIPVVALVDTNTNPSKIDYPIPSNDDATRTIRLFLSAVADIIAANRTAVEADASETAGADVPREGGNGHTTAADVGAAEQAGTATAAV